MNINSVILKLTKQQQQQMLRFIAERGLVFDSRTRHMFSLSRYIMGKLISAKPSSRKNEGTLIEIYRHFLMRCSMKFGLIISDQFVLRGRSKLINLSLVSQLMNSNSFQQQLRSIPNYGFAICLGNTGAIAEIVLRLSKCIFYYTNEIVDNRLDNKLLRFIEYGISRRCPDCLAVMAYFLDIGMGNLPVDQQRALKLAGESAEAGSVIGWKVLANLLEYNASNQDSFNDEIYVDETEAGVRQYVGIFIKEKKQEEDNTSVSRSRQTIIAKIINETIEKQILYFHP